MKKYITIIFITPLSFALLSIWFYPVASPVLGITSLLVSLALSTYAIYHKHKGTENARPKILKEVGVMVFTLIAVLFLGGIAAMLANAQVSVRWGEVAGIVSAIGASFLAGYLVRKGMLRLAG
jgi:fructose-specific phosphotransferase system IIC component